MVNMFLLLIAFIINICIITIILVNKYREGPTIERKKETKHLDISPEITTKPISINDILSESSGIKKIEEKEEVEKFDRIREIDEPFLSLPMADLRTREFAIYSFQFDIVRNKIHHFEQIERKTFSDVFNSKIKYLIITKNDKIILITHLNEISFSRIEIDRNVEFIEIKEGSFYAKQKLNEMRKIVFSRMIIGDFKAECIKSVKKCVLPVFFNSLLEVLEISYDFIDDVVAEFFRFLNEKFLISTDEEDEKTAIFLLEENVNPRHFLNWRFNNFFKRNKRKSISNNESLKMIDDVFVSQFGAHEFTNFLTFVAHLFIFDDEKSK